MRDFAAEAGRNRDDITAAVYLTMRIDGDARTASAHIDAFLHSYYGAAAAGIRNAQACFGGPEAQAIDWLREFVDAGAQHLMIRLAGDHERQMEAVARIREKLV